MPISAARLRRLPEKGIAVLRSDLAALEAECGQELRRSVYNNYKPFIEASQVGMALSSVRQHRWAQCNLMLLTRMQNGCVAHPIRTNVW